MRPHSTKWLWPSFYLSYIICHKWVCTEITWCFTKRHKVNVNKKKHSTAYTTRPYGYVWGFFFRTVKQQFFLVSIHCEFFVPDQISTNNLPTVCAQDHLAKPTWLCRRWSNGRRGIFCSDVSDIMSRRCEFTPVSNNSVQLIPTYNVNVTDALQTHQWVSSFLTAHQHKIGHSVPYVVKIS